MGRRSRYTGGMNYAILRTQKLKSQVAVMRSLKHSFRTQDTPNADPELLSHNIHIGAETVGEGMAAFRERLPEKIRKNGVLCVEYLVTASPEIMKSMDRISQDAYFDDALQWLKDKHGADNVVYAGIHRDETTPHLYAYVVPLDPDTGRLNCRRFLGGAKALSDMQTDFAEKVGKKHGLERGIKGSKARHQTISKFYNGLNQQAENQPVITGADVEPQVLEKGFFSKTMESPDMVAGRINEKLNDAMAQTVSKALQVDRQTQESQKLAKELQMARERLEQLEKPFKGLTQQEKDSIMKSAVRLQLEKEIERQKKQRITKENRSTRGFSR